MQSWFAQLQLVSEGKAPASAVHPNDVVESPASTTLSSAISNVLSYITPQADSVYDVRSTTRAGTPSENHFSTPRPESGHFSTAQSESDLVSPIAASRDFVDVDEAGFYDARSKSARFAPSEDLQHEFEDFRSEKELPIRRSERHAVIDQLVEKTFASVCSLQPDHLLRPLSMDHDDQPLASNVSELASRVEELTTRISRMEGLPARIEALTIDLHHLQFTATLTLELQNMLAEKLYPSD